MKLKFLGAALFTVLLLPSVLYAQDATVIGRVLDSTDAVLPGVTVTALNADNGTTSFGVSDASGNYRLAVRPGTYSITAELPGFESAVRENMELSVGASVTLDLRMRLAGVAETITVTGQAPLVDTSTSRVGGVIDRRQVEELPVNGRNFVDLTMLAPGSRANAVTESATPRNSSGGESQLNVDGQQVTQMTCCQDSFGNPRYSKGQHRGVRGGDEPVRRVAGALGRRADQRGHEIGDEPVCGQRGRLFPPRQLQRRGPHRRSRAAV